MKTIRSVLAAKRIVYMIESEGDPYEASAYPVNVTDLEAAAVQLSKDHGQEVGQRVAKGKDWIAFGVNIGRQGETHYVLAWSENTVWEAIKDRRLADWFEGFERGGSDEPTAQPLEPKGVSTESGKYGLTIRLRLTFHSNTQVTADKADEFGETLARVLYDQLPGDLEAMDTNQILVKVEKLPVPGIFTL